MKVFKTDKSMASVKTRFSVASLCVFCVQYFLGPIPQNAQIKAEMHIPNRVFQTSTLVFAKRLTLALLIAHAFYRTAKGVGGRPFDLLAAQRSVECGSQIIFRYVAARAVVVDRSVV